MRTVRIYEPSQLTLNSFQELSPDGAGHVGRVLRMNTGEKIVLFNGFGGEYNCTISESSKKHVIVHIDSFEDTSVESPIKIHLGQVLSRGDKMEFTIQKAVELGITEITPLISCRCGVRLKDERLIKKQDSFQKIIISACEQSGRTIVPQINPVITLEEFLLQANNDCKLTLNPYAHKHITNIEKSSNSAYRLLIGPEGGFSDEEVSLTKQNGYEDVLLGPRILRTETAALVAVSILQSAFGDL
jgi:16S rRNA (uracil1498-N3)-methyltransferase